VTLRVPANPATDQRRTVMHMNNEREVFGERMSIYFPILGKIISSFEGTPYHFMDVKAFGKVMENDPSEGSYIYWKELLSRAHFAAASGMYRSYRWAEAIMFSHAQSHFLSFAASFRGFIESSSDLFDGLNGVPLSLATHFKLILPILERKPNSLKIFAPDIEDRLIHFSHGRKLEKNEIAPDTHKAKSVRDYLNKLGNDAETITKCYSYLCQITHPAALSVLPILLPTKNDGSSFVINLNNDAALINHFLKEYSGVIEPLFSYSFNLGLLTLKLLNRFPIPDYYTEYMESISLDDINTWKKIESILEA
jgi:hypothetical protein